MDLILDKQGAFLEKLAETLSATLDAGLGKAIKAEEGVKKATERIEPVLQSEHVQSLLSVKKSVEAAGAAQKSNDGVQRWLELFNTTTPDWRRAVGQSMGAFRTHLAEAKVQVAKGGEEVLDTLRNGTIDADLKAQGAQEAARLMGTYDQAEVTAAQSLGRVVDTMAADSNAANRDEAIFQQQLRESLSGAERVEQDAASHTSAVAEKLDGLNAGLPAGVQSAVAESGRRPSAAAS